MERENWKGWKSFIKINSSTLLKYGSNFDDEIADSPLQGLQAVNCSWRIVWMHFCRTQNSSQSSFNQPWRESTLEIGLEMLRQFCQETRRGRPRWWQTRHQLAPPLCKKNKNIYEYIFKWHVTCDAWLVTLTVREIWCFEDIFRISEWVSHSLNHSRSCLWTTWLHLSNKG